MYETNLPEYTPYESYNKYFMLPTNIKMTLTRKVNEEKNSKEEV